MAKSCLQIIQTVCKRIGILSPNAAVGSTDPQIIQLVALSEEEGQEQAERYQWQALQTETVFQTVAAELQGDMDTLAPNMNYIINDTIWNRDLRRPVYGPKTVQDWQQVVAIQINGPFNAFRIKDDQMYFYPAPAAGQTCAFEYITNNWVSMASGAGGASSWMTDLDTPLLKDELIIQGTIWRWKAAKGFDYSEDFAKYERRLNDAMARDASKPVLNTQGQTAYEILPAIAIPRGSWG